MNFARWPLLLLPFVLLFMTALLPDCSDPEAICLAAADISAQTSFRCFPDTSYEEHRQAFIDSAALGDCKTIRRIRDISSLEKHCLPWLQTVSCHILKTGKRPAACQGQLIMNPNEL